MTKRKKTKEQALNVRLAKLMREYVNCWIESGCYTYDMDERSPRVVGAVRDLLARDIRLFAETGKYPEYAEQETSE
jgi:hypothetical protein